METKSDSQTIGNVESAVEQPAVEQAKDASASKDNIMSIVEEQGKQIRKLRARIKKMQSAPADKPEAAPDGASVTSAAVISSEQHRAPKGGLVEIVAVHWKQWGARKRKVEHDGRS